MVNDFYLFGAPATAESARRQSSPRSLARNKAAVTAFPRMRGCSEREARAAAREAGLRDPEVVRVTPGRVVVEGFTRRGPDRITFANERGCPEI